MLNLEQTIGLTRAVPITTTIGGLSCRLTLVDDPVLVEQALHVAHPQLETVDVFLSPLDELRAEAVVHLEKKKIPVMFTKRAVSRRKAQQRQLP